MIVLCLEITQFARGASYAINSVGWKNMFEFSLFIRNQTKQLLELQSKLNSISGQMHEFQMLFLIRS